MQSIQLNIGKMQGELWPTGNLNLKVMWDDILIYV